MTLKWIKFQNPADSLFPFCNGLFPVWQFCCWYDTIEEFNEDSKAEYTAQSSTRSQKLKQTKQCTNVIPLVIGKLA